MKLGYLALLAGGPPQIVGWKIGLTTKRMQQMCGVDAPIGGAVLAGRIHSAPARVAVASYVRLGVESEIAEDAVSLSAFRRIARSDIFFGASRATSTAKN